MYMETILMSQDECYIKIQVTVIQSLVCGLRIKVIHLLKMHEGTGNIAWPDIHIIITFMGFVIGSCGGYFCKHYQNCLPLVHAQRKSMENLPCDE